MIEELRKTFNEHFKPQRDAFRKLMAELDGKVMNYETCRVLEDLWEDYNKEIVNQIEIALTEAKKKLGVKNANKEKEELERLKRYLCSEYYQRKDEYNFTESSLDRISQIGIIEAIDKSIINADAINAKGVENDN